MAGSEGTTSKDEVKVGGGSERVEAHSRKKKTPHYVLRRFRTSVSSFSQSTSQETPDIARPRTANLHMVPPVQPAVAEMLKLFLALLCILAVIVRLESISATVLPAEEEPEC